MVLENAAVVMKSMDVYTIGGTEKKPVFIYPTPCRLKDAAALQEVPVPSLEEDLDPRP